jgi:hypothetical protein
MHRRFGTYQSERESNFRKLMQDAVRGCVPSSESKTNPEVVMSPRQILAIFVGIVSLATGILAVRIVWFSSDTSPQDVPDPSPPPSKQHELPTASGKKISGPFAHKNLTFYLVHGDDSLSGKTPLTLEEAMDRKLVVVHETGDVNELSIENVSRNEEVFVQAGDIVKGGQQDRMLAVDLIVPAQSGRIPIDSFCVESDRWAARGTESRSEFHSSAEYAPSKDLKMAAKHSKSQSEVWSRVADSQEKLSAATNSNAASHVSQSSLPLTLENPRVRSDAETYTKFLSDIVDHKSDVIGIVMVINGKINGADTYGSSKLFVKLWPKLLKAAAIEAVAESREPGSSKNVATRDDVASFFENAERSPVTEERTVTDRIRMITRTSEASVFLTTLDRDNMLHKNYLMK